MGWFCMHPSSHARTGWNRSHRYRNKRFISIKTTFLVTIPPHVPLSHCYRYRSKQFTSTIKTTSLSILPHVPHHASTIIGVNNKNNFSTTSGIYSIFSVPNQPLSPPLHFFLFFFQIWIDPPSQPIDRRRTMEEDDDTMAVDGSGRRAVAGSAWDEGTASGLAAAASASDRC